MAIRTPTHGAPIFAGRMLLDVTVAAERVEHRFDLEAHLGVGAVAVDAEPLAGVVGKVVVAHDAIDFAMIEMRERQRQQRAGVDHLLTALIGGDHCNSDEDAHYGGECGAASGGFHSRLRKTEKVAAIASAAAQI